MIAGRIVALLAVIILASSVVQAVVHALIPLVPLLIILGLAVTAAFAFFRYNDSDRW